MVYMLLPHAHIYSLLNFIADSNRDFLITSHTLAIQLRNVKGNLCLKNII